MIIRTTAELRAAREFYGLNHRELGAMTGDTESFIRSLENPRTMDIPRRVVTAVNDLASTRSKMMSAWQTTRGAQTLITYNNDEDLEDRGEEWDLIAPTASFHRATVAHLARLLSQEHRYDVLTVTFSPRLFDESEWGSSDTADSRIAWARDWASQQIIKEST